MPTLRLHNVWHSVFVPERSRIIAPFPDGQRVTLSMGIVVSPFGSDLREAVMRADQQLYKAKELGRDQVVAHGPGDVAAAA